MGDFLIVGLYDDDIVSAKKGSYYPILALQERVLTVLAMRYVDEVIIGAPCKTISLLINTCFI
jgi:ethanolamine-phosphate cytidylyltransferase